MNERAITTSEPASAMNTRRAAANVSSESTGCLARRHPRSYDRRTRAVHMRILEGAVLLAATLATMTLTGCELDLENPNSPTEEEVLADVDGMIALGVGMQAQYTSSIDTYVRAPALVSDEWGLKVAALACDETLLTGENVAILNACTNVSGPYYVTYRVIRSANLLLENAPQLNRLGVALQTGLVALAKLFKAMALGSAVLNFEEVAVDADPDGALPQPRDAVLDTIVSLLESARTDLDGVAESELTTFRERVLGDGIALRSTINAMLARYYLIQQQYQQAIDAADRVDLAELSVFEYAGTDINPIYNYAVEADYTRPLWSFVEHAEAGDQRPGFWAVTDTAAVFAGQPDSLLTELAQYATRDDPYPIYIPNEMLLIKAEASSRLGDIAQARELVNQVRTQCDPALEVPAACLPALPEAALDTEDELLQQIAYERRYELYMQGLRWEDMRRLGQYIDGQPVIEFLPFPDSECQRNPNLQC